mmetsp:Transcript_3887/g.9807  ORF Transcript_3887/g.9807 Transcript_3887/m.9807 type:complete len:207 (-) Transcript_3887:1321-1941(-)
MASRMWKYKAMPSFFLRSASDVNELELVPTLVPDSWALRFPSGDPTAGSTLSASSATYASIFPRRSLTSFDPPWLVPAAGSLSEEVQRAKMRSSSGLVPFMCCETAFLSQWEAAMASEMGVGGATRLRRAGLWGTDPAGRRWMKGDGQLRVSLSLIPPDPGCPASDCATLSGLRLFSRGVILLELPNALLDAVSAKSRASISPLRR